IILDEFNPDDFQYSLILSNNSEGEGITEIRTSDKMYPNGFNITIQPIDVKVELLPIDSIIRITVTAGINEKQLHVKIIKNTSNSIKFTYNGKDISDKKHKKENIDNEPITRIQTEGQDQQTNVQPEVLQPEVVQPEVVQPEVIQPEVVQPEVVQSEVVQPEVVHEIDQDEQTSEVNIQSDSDISTKVFSRSIDPTMINRSIDPIKINNSINLSKNSDNVVIHSKIYKQKSDLIVFSEQIRFDYKQIGVMFASMLLAYQAGKLSGC
ncbi:3299_t:CDS:2, partial [Scutellospora calospora]